MRRAQIGLEKRVRSRLQLLRSAIAMVGCQGGQATSIDDVIAHAGVSRGTFYNYFDSRDHLLSVVAIELSLDFNDAIINALHNENDAAVRGAVGMRHYITKAQREPEWGWAMVNIAMHGPLLGTDTLYHIDDTIRRGMESGRFTVKSHQAAVDMLCGTIITGMSSVLTTKPSKSYAQEIALMLLLSVGVKAADAEKIAYAKLPKLQQVDRSHERSYLELSLASAKDGAGPVSEKSRK